METGTEPQRKRLAINFLPVNSSIDFPPALITAISSGFKLRLGPLPDCALAYALALK